MAFHPRSLVALPPPGPRATRDTRARWAPALPAGAACRARPGVARPGSQQVDLVQVAGQDRVPHVLEDLADVLRVRGARVVAEEAPGARALLAAVRAVRAAGVHAAVHVQDELLGCLRVLLRAWGCRVGGQQSGRQAPRAGGPRRGSADPAAGS